MSCNDDLSDPIFKGLTDLINSFNLQLFDDFTWKNLTLTFLRILKFNLGIYELEGGSGNIRHELRRFFHTRNQKTKINDLESEYRSIGTVLGISSEVFLKKIDFICQLVGDANYTVDEFRIRWRNPSQISREYFGSFDNQENLKRPFIPEIKFLFTMKNRISHSAPSFGEEEIIKLLIGYYALIHAIERKEGSIRRHIENSVSLLLNYRHLNPFEGFLQIYEIHKTLLHWTNEKFNEATAKYEKQKAIISDFSVRYVNHYPPQNPYNLIEFQHLQTLAVIGCKISHLLRGYPNIEEENLRNLQEKLSKIKNFSENNEKLVHKLLIESIPIFLDSSEFFRVQGNVNEIYDIYQEKLREFLTSVQGEIITLHEAYDLYLMEEDYDQYDEYDPIIYATFIRERVKCDKCQYIFIVELERATPDHYKDPPPTEWWFEGNCENCDANIDVYLFAEWDRYHIDFERYYENHGVELLSWE